MNSIGELVTDKQRAIYERYVQANDRFLNYGTPRTRETLLERDEHRCVVCDSVRHLQQDHIWPRSRGGEDHIRNLQVLCRDCNLSKSDMWFDEWLPERLSEIGGIREPKLLCPNCFAPLDCDPYEAPPNIMCFECWYGTTREQAWLVDTGTESSWAAFRRAERGRT